MLQFLSHCSKYWIVLHISIAVVIFDFMFSRYSLKMPFLVIKVMTCTTPKK